jgi:hypothetical protein
MSVAIVSDMAQESQKAGITYHVAPQFWRSSTTGAASAVAARAAARKTRLAVMMLGSQERAVFCVVPDIMLQIKGREGVQSKGRASFYQLATFGQPNDTTYLRNCGKGCLAIEHGREAACGGTWHH